MSIEFNTHDISAKYDRFARWYDWVEGIPDLLGLRGLRRHLLRRVSGQVLEVAVGTGKNLPHYSPDATIVAVELSREMLNIARKRAAKLSANVLFLVADAETLPFPGKSFDTIVSSLSTCTFPSPIVALGEMARVCRTDGKVFLLEHGRSDWERLGRWQDRHADQFAKPLGCHWNREPLEMARKAGLKVTTARRFCLGIFYQIEGCKNIRRCLAGYRGRSGNRRFVSQECFFSAARIFF